MLDALSAPPIGIDVSLCPFEDKNVEELSPGKFQCLANQFVKISYKFSNRLDHPAKLFFRVQPMLDQHNTKADYQISDYVWWTGQLQTVLPAVRSFLYVFLSNFWQRYRLILTGRMNKHFVVKLADFIPLSAMPSY